MVVEQVAGSQQAIHILRREVQDCVAETREMRATLERRIGSVEDELVKLTKVLRHFLYGELEAGEFPHCRSQSRSLRAHVFLLPSSV